MSVQLIDEKLPQTEPQAEEVIPLPPTDLPYDDGEPLESNRHRIAMNVLIASLHQAYQGRNDYYAGGNMFVYYSSAQARNQDFRGPDFFVVLDVDGTLERRSWILWEEQGRYPDVIVELMSSSTAQVDGNQKKELYEKVWKTNDYFIYDPFDSESLQGWNLSGKRKYDEIAPNDRGWLWCESLGLYLGTWNGELMKENAPWLRFYDAQGNLVLLPEEVAVREQERADRQQERADTAELELESERQEKEAERQRADRAESDLQQLREKLRQLNIDPDTLS